MPKTCRTPYRPSCSISTSAPVLAIVNLLRREIVFAPVTLPRPLLWRDRRRPDRMLPVPPSTTGWPGQSGAVQEMPGEAVSPGVARGRMDGHPRVVGAYVEAELPEVLVQVFGSLPL